MRAPDQRRVRDDKYVAAIVDRLKAPDPEAAAVLASVSIKYCRTIAEVLPLWGKRTANRKALEAIHDHTVKVQLQLKKLHPSVMTLLFSVQREAVIPSLDEQARTVQRVEAATWAFKFARARSRHLLDIALGAHGNEDFLQRLVAGEACSLLRVYGRKPSGGAAGSVLGDVAILLFEAVTGRQVTDLELACKAELARQRVGGGWNAGVSGAQWPRGAGPVRRPRVFLGTEK
jgi:hypothetical protein